MNSWTSEWMNEWLIVAIPSPDKIIMNAADLLVVQIRIFSVYVIWSWDFQLYASLFVELCKICVWSSILESLFFCLGMDSGN